jgi:hypothetical protein
MDLGTGQEIDESLSRFGLLRTGHYRRRENCGLLEIARQRADDFDAVLNGLELRRHAPAAGAVQLPYSWEAHRARKAR